MAALSRQLALFDAGLALKVYKDRDWLIERYINQGLSVQACADLSGCGVTGTCVHHWLKVHGIPIRPKNHHMKGDNNPRLGKPLPPEVRAKIAAALVGHKRSAESIRKQKEKIGGPKSVNFGKPRRHGKTLWLAFPGQEPFAVRSRWEALFADRLTVEGKEWFYEPETFLLADGSAYTPDFLCEGVYYEVKGYMTPGDQAKVDGFREKYPHLPLVVIAKPEMDAIGLSARKVLHLERLSVVSGRVRTCPACGQQFIPPVKRAMYCGVKCAATKSIKPKHVIRCVICGDPREVRPSDVDRLKTCSRPCARALAVKNRRERGPWFPKRAQS
jgi:hypothetical protein